MLLKITLNSIQIALEKFLHHFVRYCGYLTCCLGCKKYLACNFESMTATKRNLGNKRRRGSGFHNWDSFYIYFFQPYKISSRVSLNCEKLLPLRLLFSKFLFVGVIDSKLHAKYSLHPRQHVRCPQYFTKWCRNFSKTIWIEFNVFFKNTFFALILKIL